MLHTICNYFFSFRKSFLCELCAFIIFVIPTWTFMCVTIIRQKEFGRVVIARKYYFYLHFAFNISRLWIIFASKCILGSNLTSSLHVMVINARKFIFSPKLIQLGFIFKLFNQNKTNILTSFFFLKISPEDYYLPLLLTLQTAVQSHHQSILFQQKCFGYCLKYWEHYLPPLVFCFVKNLWKFKFLSFIKLKQSKCINAFYKKN